MNMAVQIAYSPESSAGTVASIRLELRQDLARDTSTSINSHRLEMGIKGVINMSIPNFKFYKGFTPQELLSYLKDMPQNREAVGRFLRRYKFVDHNWEVR